MKTRIRPSRWPQTWMPASGRPKCSGRVLAQWMQSDPEAAVSWIVSQDDDTSRELLSEGSSLIQESPEAAMRLLPLLDGETEQQWRYQIAQQLASSRSPEAAIEFANRFQGQEGYESLMSAVVMGLAHRDPDRALTMAAQLSDARGRDAAYAQVVGRAWQGSPSEAVALLNMISTEQYREMAATSISSEWSRSDPRSCPSLGRLVAVGTYPGCGDRWLRCQARVRRPGGRSAD